jgi:hypothetical protein
LNESVALSLDRNSSFFTLLYLNVALIFNARCVSEMVAFSGGKVVAAIVHCRIQKVPSAVQASMQSSVVLTYEEFYLGALHPSIRERRIRVCEGARVNDVQHIWVNLTHGNIEDACFIAFSAGKSNLADVAGLPPALRMKYGGGQQDEGGVIRDLGNVCFMHKLVCLEQVYAFGHHN